MLKLPFGTLPGHWGLAGTTREIAKAEYELEGWALETRLLEIKKDELGVDEFTRRYIEANFKYGKYTESEYKRGLANLIKDDTQRALTTLDLDFAEGKIGELAYQKSAATLRNEPWVTVINMDFVSKTALEGSFELDWNPQFVAKLEAEGYSGPTPDNVVNQWFMEVCRNIAMEEFDGTGDFTADSEANLDAMKRWSTDKKDFPGGRKGYS